MKTVTLHRVSQTDRGTCGVLVDGDARIVTLERPWRDNAPNVSCIPAGNYSCSRITSQKFGLTFHVENVPGRSEIIFHAGNTISDSRGCILVGCSFDNFGKDLIIRDSRRGMKIFLELLRNVQQFDLKVSEAHR